MKSSRQLKDLIKNMAKEKDINSQILLRNYMLERLLERIALSDFRNNFILKGGMLVAAIVGVDMRSTIDMDATMKGFPLTKESIQRAINIILSVPVNDGVTMMLKKTDEIRDEGLYAGFRLSLESRIDNARIPIKVDITTGDQITPKETIYKFKLLLEDRYIDVLAYNIETVMAEKLETMISRGIANTRMRDFYDIYILLKLQESNITPELLTKAVLDTAERRETMFQLMEGTTILEEVLSSEVLYKSWQRFRKKYMYADDITWEAITESVFKLWKMIDFGSEK
ncbi:nucleotidyl transferase AbiEii/AbiGii toxin family protein [Virgibacillus sp. NKC19-16]|uniref:nucleotidyl transferase AbiEii/AbiGii toxin family protein n=1 Tax=Virgibacillus salidurans TaxID=2831673 RepID=UPI001F3D4A99|nr:nucleotidyl transferase AbiEii/AbiGii toxin family protein [Virgibacillus sp. NKC19-16]UJL45832.1 nucleotidyl transferase AbiEii/AbiGii toxin family protein [Virgibacillus sp. NKC19-16]